MLYNNYYLYFFFSYLELLGTFRKLVGMKKTELSTARNRTKVGLDKVGVIAPLLQAILGSRLRINFRTSFRVFKEKRSSMKAFTVLFFICQIEVSRVSKGEVKASGFKFHV